MTLSFKTCPYCKGSQVIVRQVGVSPSGIRIVEELPCPPCEGTGQVADTRERPEAIIAWVAFGIAVLIVFIVSCAVLSVPRSSPDPTAASPSSSMAGFARVPETAAVASGRSSSGAPSPASASVGVSGPLGAPSSPAVGGYEPDVLGAVRTVSRPAGSFGSKPASEPVSLAAETRGSAAWAMHGWATHYAACGRCGAASGELQEQIGKGWKGSWVHVTRVDTGASVNVKLVTGCGCGERTRDGQTLGTIIDLSVSAFEELAPYGMGYFEAEVTPIGAPPATDTAP